jgi:hypothetical protein
MTTFARHCSAAAVGLSEAAFMVARNDRAAAADSIATVLSDLTVCIGELGAMTARPAVAKRLAAQLRRVADQWDARTEMEKTG